MLQFYTSENSVFKGYKMGTLARNGLKDFKKTNIGAMLYVRFVTRLAALLR